MQHYVGLDVSVKETSVCIVEPSFAGAENKLRRHDWERPMVGVCASRQHGCLLGARVRRQAPRLRRAAVRLWGLTAQRDRANRRPCRLHTCDAHHVVSQLCTIAIGEN